VDVTFTQVPYSATFGKQSREPTRTAVFSVSDPCALNCFSSPSSNDTLNLI
jgi:hypothetical protein